MDKGFRQLFTLQFVTLIVNGAAATDLSTILICFFVVVVTVFNVGPPPIMIAIDFVVLLKPNAGDNERSLQSTIVRDVWRYFDKQPTSNFIFDEDDVADRTSDDNISTIGRANSIAKSRFLNNKDRISRDEVGVFVFSGYRFIIILF